MSSSGPEAAPASVPAGETGSARRSRALVFAGKLTLALGGTVVMLLLLELIARAVLVDPGLAIWNLHACVRPSALLGQEFKPFCSGNLANTEFHTNSLGLRGDEVPDDGTARILAIGDSCTWGWGVAESDAYPSFLQRMLDYNSGGRHYTVINAGVPGFTSYQGLLYLRERGALLRPQIVLIGYGFNDQTRVGDIRDLIATNRRIMPLLRIDEILGTHSLLYRWARYKMIKPRPEGLPPRVSVDQYEANLGAIVDVVRGIGARPVLLSFLRPENAYAPAEKAAADKLGVPLVRYQGPRLDLVHPTADGYSRFATVLYDRLHAEGYL